MLKVKELDLFYGSVPILENVTFSVSQGSMLGLVGPNGAGKSSLIKVLAGLVFPQKGQLSLNGQATPFEDLRTVTGYLIDGPSFYPQLSGLVNLRLLKTLNNSKADLDTLLNQVGLSEAKQKKVKAYSTGMKQRLAIASTLLRSPDLLILDEPFNGLDPGGYKELWDLLMDLNSKGVTIIISSHLLADLEEHSTDFLLLNKGKVALQMSKEDLESSDRMVTFYFENPLSVSELILFNEYEYKEKDCAVQVSLKSKDIAGMIKRLVDQGNAPINIKTENILQQTYFSLSR